MPSSRNAQRVDELRRRVHARRCRATNTRAARRDLEPGRTSQIVEARRDAADFQVGCGLHRDRRRRSVHTSDDERLPGERRMRRIGPATAGSSHRSAGTYRTPPSLHRRLRPRSIPSGFDVAVEDSPA